MKTARVYLSKRNQSESLGLYAKSVKNLFRSLAVFYFLAVILPPLKIHFQIWLFLYSLLDI